LIGEARGIVTADSSHIVAEVFEVGKQPGISALIQEKLHTWGGGVRFSSTAL
jgi:hypothetical protein